MRGFSSAFLAVALTACSGGAPEGNTAAPAAGTNATASVSAPPAACDALRAAGVDTVLGGAAQLTEQSRVENPDVLLTMCEASAGGKRVSLQLRWQKTTTYLKPSAEQKADMTRELTDNPSGMYNFANGPQIAEAQAGEAAMWVGALNQVIFWHIGGRAQSIVSGDKAIAEAMAQAVAAKYP